jgi:outer membrane protein
MLILVKLLFFVSICLNVNALTLNEALINTYKTNPELNAQRESLKASDEQIMQSLSGWLPSVSLKSSKQYISSKKQQVPGSNTSANKADDASGHQLTISQNIFRGGADIASMQAAYYAIKNARANLESTEQKVFLKVVESYMSTLQNEEAYRIALESEKDSTRILQSVKHRFKVGDASKLDVELAKASTSSAKSQRIIVLSNYESSKANLEAVTGLLPNNLSIPKDDIAIPKSLNETVDMSILKNPSLLASKNEAESAKKSVDVQKGDVLPSVDLSHSINDNTKAGYSTTRGLRDHTTVLQLNVPIFTVKQWSELRAQKRKAASSQSQLTSATDTTRANALQSWVALNAQKESLKAQEDEYKARRIAYDGAIAMEKAGQISTIDLVTTKNDYFNSYSRYLKTRSDYYNALYTVKSIVGECTAQGLGLEVKYYDPLKNYNSIKWQLIGAF